MGLRFHSMTGAPPVAATSGPERQGTDSLWQNDLRFQRILQALLFRELEQRGIACVILHSYQEFPDNISSDIDYAVPHEHLPKLRGIQAELARQNGWALAQTLQHGVFAFYAVLVNLSNPARMPETGRVFELRARAPIACAGKGAARYAHALPGIFHSRAGRGIHLCAGKGF